MGRNITGHHGPRQHRAPCDSYVLRLRARPSPLLHLSLARQGNRIGLVGGRNARAACSTSPRVRGEVDFASGALAKRSKSGEGACPQAQARGYAPSPGFLRCARNPTSPRTRGEVEQVALPCTSRYQLICDSPGARGERWSPWLPMCVQSSAGMIPVTTFARRRVALFGLGGSGLASARALQAGGADVVAFDDDPKKLAQANGEGIATEDLRRVDWSTIAALLLAPGVPLTHPAPHWTVGLARNAAVEVIGDIELFCRERRRTAP